MLTMWSRALRHHLPPAEDPDGRLRLRLAGVPARHAANNHTTWPHRRRRRREHKCSTRARTVARARRGRRGRRRADNLRGNACAAAGTSHIEVDGRRRGAAPDSNGGRWRPDGPHHLPSSAGAVRALHAKPRIYCPRIAPQELSARSRKLRAAAGLAMLDVREEGVYQRNNRSSLDRRPVAPGTAHRPPGAAARHAHRAG